MPKRNKVRLFAHNLGTTSIVVLPTAIVVTIAPAVMHFVLVTVSTVMPRGVVVYFGSCSTSSALRAAVAAGSDPVNNRTSPPAKP